MRSKRPSFIARVFKPFFHVARHALYQPVTHKYPFERIRGYPRTRGFITLNMDTCVGCGVCAHICPDKAIKMTVVEGKPYTYPSFDFGKCCFCGLCVESCPTESLKTTDIVELASFEYSGLVYPPDKLKEPDLKRLLPQMKYELKTAISKNKGPYYIRRRVR